MARREKARRVFRAALACMVLFSLLQGARARQDAYPSRPVRIVVPYAPGGLPDITARLIADNLSAKAGQAVVVDNRPGANGTIGSALVARAEPDGYTLAMVASSHVFAPALMPALPFDPLKDFAPVTLAVRTPVVLVSSPALPAATMAAFLAYARSHPDSLSFASAGNGSNVHVFGQWFNDAAGLRMVHAPYKGAAAAHLDLVAGRVSVAFDTLPSVASLIGGGKLRLLAVGGTARLPQFPNTPTVAESGIPAFVADSWAALLAPARTPPATIAMLNGQVNAILQSPKVRTLLAEAGAEAAGDTPAQLGEMLATEQRRYGELIRRLRITAE